MVFLFKTLLLIAFFLLSSCSINRPVQDIYQEAASAVVHIDTEDGSCSGYHVGDGFIITAAHCIDTPIEIEVTVDYYTKIKFFKTLLVDHKTDTGIIWTPEFKYLPALDFADSEPEVGEAINVIGFPGHLRKRTVDLGYVTAIDIVNGVKIILGSGNAFPGESGGPALNGKGFVMGTVSAVSINILRFNNNTPIQRDVSIFIDKDEIIRLLKKVREKHAKK